MRPLLFLLCLAGLALGARGVDPAKPNIVLVLIDDLGQTDLGCYGSTFYQTPQIDALARAGLRFTQAYSACTVCSPTRASLLTGQSPAALRVTDWIAGHQRPFAKLRPPEWTKELPASAQTLAEVLRECGYVSGHFGKWHLGEAPATAHGFDFTVADNGRGQPASYLSPYKNAQLPDGPPGEHLSDRLTDEALRFVEQHREQPFFLYLAHYAVHTPLGGKPEVIAKYEARRTEGAPQQNAKYASLVESVDDSVGRLRARLAELKLRERTIFIFTSDNGGLLPITSNLGLRAGKGSAYEGGVRVPLIVEWPGVTEPGTESAAPVISYDLFPTLARAAGGRIPEAVEGCDLAPELRQGALPPRALFWHYPHYHPGGATPYSAIREGDWKLIAFYETGRAELYNLRTDPLEEHDLAASESVKAAELLGKLAAWRERAGAQPPLPNPDYDPARANQPLRKNRQNSAAAAE